MLDVDLGWRGADLYPMLYLKALLGPPGPIAVAPWRASDIYETAAILSLFTMLFVAVLSASIDLGVARSDREPK